MNIHVPHIRAVLVVVLGIVAAILALPRAAPAQAADRLVVPVWRGNPNYDNLRCVVQHGPTTAVTSLAFSPDGNTLATNGYHEVVLWDLATGKIARRIPIDGLVRVVAFATDKSLYVGGGEYGSSGIIVGLDVDTAKLHPLTGPGDVVSALAVSPDGKLLVAGSDDSNVYVYSLPENKPVIQFTAHSGRVTVARFSPDGKMLLTAASDKSAKVWSVGGEWELVSTHTTPEPIRDADFDASGKDLLMLIDGPSQSQIFARKAEIARKGARTYWTGGAIPQQMALAPKTDKFYLATSMGRIRIYEAKNRKMRRGMPGAAAQTFSMAVSPDCKLLATGGDDGSVRLFDLEKEILRAKLLRKVLAGEKTPLPKLP